MKKTKDVSQTKLIIGGFVIIAIIQIVGFWYVTEQGVQRTQELMEMNLRHYVEAEKSKSSQE